MSVTKGLQPLAGSCGVIRKVDAAEMPKQVGERSVWKEQVAPEASKSKEISRNLHTSLPMASLHVLPPEYNLTKTLRFSRRYHIWMGMPTISKTARRVVSTLGSPNSSAQPRPRQPRQIKRRIHLFLPNPFPCPPLPLPPSPLIPYCTSPTPTSTNQA